MQHLTNRSDNYYVTFHAEYNVQGTPPHHSFNLLISVECACVEHYPCVYCTR